MEQPLTDPLYLDVKLDSGAEFNELLDPEYNAFVYVIEGRLTLADDRDSPTTLARDQLGILGQGDEVRLAGGDGGARFLLVAGRPLGEPIARGGPFVMNTEAEVHQAFTDYRTGNF